MTDKQLRGTAHHEAGHAVVAWLCDCAIDEATIRDHEDYHGRVRLSDYGRNDLFGSNMIVSRPDAPGGLAVRTGDRSARHLTEDELHWMELHKHFSNSGGGQKKRDEARVMVAVAGVAAERKLALGTIGNQSIVADFESVTENLDRLAHGSGKPVKEVRAQLLKSTVGLIRDQLVWRVVRALAAALLKEETLSGEDVTRVIRQTVTGLPVPRPRPRVGRPRGGRKRA